MSDDLRNKEDIAATARRMSAKKLYRTPVFIRLGTLYDLTMSHGNARKDGGTIIRPTFTGRGGRNGGSHQ